MGVIFQNGMAIGAVPGFSSYGISRAWILGTDDFGCQPAWDNGVLTLLPPSTGCTGTADLISVFSGNDPDFGFYISGIDSTGANQTSFLAQAIGQAGTMTFTQGGSSVTIGFDETTFAANQNSASDGLYYDNSPGTTAPYYISGSGAFYGFNNAGQGTNSNGGSGEQYFVQPSNSQLLTISINVGVTTPTPTPTVTKTPTPTPTQTPTSGATPAALLIFSEVGSDVVMTASGTIDLTGLTLATAGTGPLGGGGLGPNTATYIMGTTGVTFDLYSGFTTNPTSFGTGSGLPASSSIGDIFGVVYQGTPPHQLAVPSGYTSGNNISSLQTFTSATFNSLGLTQGTYTYTWGSGKSFNVVIGNGVNPTPTPTPTQTNTPTPSA